MNQKKAIKCSECEHCDGYRGPRNKTTAFKCVHPDQSYINDYFKKKRMNKAPAFLGCSAINSTLVPVKTSPAWCPKKKPHNNI